MSIHRSLRTTSSALNQHRNVLKRSERIALMTDRDTFDPKKDSPLGLVKYASRKSTTGKKPKKVAGEGEAEAAAPAKGGKGGKAAPAAAAAAKPAAKAAKK